MVEEEVRKKKEIEEERKAREGEKEKEGWEKEGEKKEEGEKKQEKVGEKREGKEEKKKGIKGTGTEGKLLERYKLNVDNAVTEVNIERTGEGIIYNLSLPEIGIGTQVLLEEIRKELVSTSTINLGELNDIKTIARMKKSFIEQTTKLLREKVPTISTEAEKFLVGMLIQEMLGLGKIEFLLNDPQLEEIVIISSKEPVRVYHKKYGWLKTNIKIEKEDDINNYANIIARRVGRQINVLTPLLDAHLITGDRANAVLFPIATKGNTITIRKFARDPWTIIDLSLIHI